MKVKIFKAASTRKLELEINGWLEAETKGGSKIDSYHQSFDNGTYLVSILYTPKKPTNARVVPV